MQIILGIIGFGVFFGILSIGMYWVSRRRKSITCGGGTDMDGEEMSCGACQCNKKRPD